MAKDIIPETIEVSQLAMVYTTFEEADFTTCIADFGLFRYGYNTDKGVEYGLGVVLIPNDTNENIKTFILETLAEDDDDDK